MPKARCDLAPIADGGEGSLGALEIALGGKRHWHTVTNAAGKQIEAYYLKVKETAYIELAQASGLPQLSEQQRNPLVTTTFGTGQLVRAAIDNHAEQVIICIGGSATNDAGVGICRALGIAFKNGKGHDFLPRGGTLSQIKQIDIPTDPVWSKTQLTVLCDVDNPFAGPQGAVATFSAQKGASSSDMDKLEEGMRHFETLVSKQFGISLNNIPGSGAAGGVGGGLLALTGAQLVPGLPYIARQMGLQQRVAEADYVFTGEGRLDKQTLHGKVIHGIVNMANTTSTPVIAICGSVALTHRDLQESGLHAAFSVQKGLRSWTEAVQSAYSDIVYTVQQIMQILKLKNPNG